MLEFGAIMLAGGLVVITAGSLLYTHWHSPQSRPENSPGRRPSNHSVPVGSPSLTNGTSRASVPPGKKRLSHKKSSFKPKKRKPRQSKVITSEPLPRKSHTPQIAVASTSISKTSTEDDDRKQLEIAASSESDSKLWEDEEMAPDNKEKEIPSELGEQADEEKDETITLQEKTFEESEQGDKNDETILVHETTEEPVPPVVAISPVAMTHPNQSCGKNEEDGSRKKRRRRRRRTNISDKTRLPTPRSNEEQTSPTSEILRDPCVTNHDSSAIPNRQSITSGLNAKPHAKQSAQVLPSPTRPPITSNTFGKRFPSNRDQSSLSNTIKDQFNILSPPPDAHKKPRKKPIVQSMFKSSTTFKSYAEDTDNDSNTSALESKMIHDSDTSSRKRAFSGASKLDGVSDFDNDDDMDQPLFDMDSVMSNSVSRTATSVSDLESEPIPKQDEDWREDEEESGNLEEEAAKNLVLGIIPVALPESLSPSPSVSRKGAQIPNERARVSVPPPPSSTPSEPRTPQQFGQHLASLAQHHQADMNAQFAQQQQPIQFAQVPIGVLPPGGLPYMSPYPPSLVDMNGNPQYYGMNMSPMFPNATMYPQFGHSTSDLMALSSGVNFTQTPLARTQSAPNLMQTVFLPQQPAQPWPPGPITVSSPDASVSPKKDKPIGRSRSDNLYVVPSASGQLSFQTDQTLGPISSTPDGGVPRLTSSSPGTTPSVTGVPNPGNAPQMLYPFPQVQFPMQVGPIYDPTFLSSFGTQFVMPQQTLVPMQQVPTPTIPVSAADAFRESVLSAPLYEPTTTPTHIPAINDPSGAAIPNPSLQQANAA